MNRGERQEEPEMWNGINLTELLEKSVPPKPKSNKVLDTLIVVSLVLIVVSKLIAPRPLGAEFPGVVITAREYGSRWPFTVQKLRIVCDRPEQVDLYREDTGQRSALTTAALNAPTGWPSFHGLLRPGAGDSLIPELIARGLELCPAAAETR